MTAREPAAARATAAQRTTTEATARAATPTPPKAAAAAALMAFGQNDKTGASRKAKMVRGEEASKLRATTHPVHCQKLVLEKVEEGTGVVGLVGQPSRRPPD